MKNAAFIAGLITCSVTVGLLTCVTDARQIRTLRLAQGLTAEVRADRGEIQSLQADVRGLRTRVSAAPIPGFPAETGL